MVDNPREHLLSGGHEGFELEVGCYVDDSSISKEIKDEVYTQFDDIIV